MTLNLSEEEKDYLRNDYARWLAEQEAKKAKVSAPATGYTATKTSKTGGLSIPVYNILSSLGSNAPISKGGIWDVSKPYSLINPSGRTSNTVSNTQPLSVLPKQTTNLSNTVQGARVNQALKPKTLEETERPTVKLATQKGTSFDWKPTDEEWSNMSVAEKINYQNNPSQWLTDKPKWEKQRALLAGIEEVAKNLFGINPQTDLYDVANNSPEAIKAQLFGAGSAVLNILPIPELKPAAKVALKGLDYIIPGLSEGVGKALSKVDQTAVIQSLKKLGSTPLGKSLTSPEFQRGSFKLGGEAAEDVTRKALKDRGFSDAYIDMMPPAEKAKALAEPIPVKQPLEAPTEAINPSAQQIPQSPVNKGAQVAKEAISNDTGQAIAKQLDVNYNGIQQGFGDTPTQYVFTDKQTGSTFMAENIETAQTKLTNMRAKFAEAGNIPPTKPPKATTASSGKPIDSLKKLEQSLQDAYDIQQGKRSTELGRRVSNAKSMIDVNDPLAMKKSTAALSGKMPVETMKLTNPLNNDEWDNIRILINNKGKTGDYFDAKHASEYVDSAQAYLMGIKDATPPTPSQREAFEKLFPDSDIPKLLSDMSEEEIMSRIVPGVPGARFGEMPPTERAGMKTGTPEQLFPNEGVSSQFGTPEATYEPLFTGEISRPLIPEEPPITQGVTWNPTTRKQWKELKKLSETAPEGFRDAAIALAKKVGNGTLEVGEAIRLFQTTLDNSFGLRQGLIASISHPIAGAKMWGRSFKSMFSQKYTDFFDEFIKSDKYANRFMRDGGFMSPTDPAEVLRVAREESLPSRLSMRGPFKPFSRAYVTAGNSIRRDLAELGYKSMERANILSEKSGKELAEWINISTGRGTIPKSLERAAPIINATLFSPRLMFARLELPLKLASSNPYVRKEAARALAGLIGFTALSMGVVKLMGGKVELDPRSAAFGKVRIGNTYIDITGGNVQYVRTIARMIPFLNPEHSIQGSTKQPGGDVVAKSQLDSMVQMLQSKESPLFSLITDILAGESYSGEKLEFTPQGISKQVIQRVAPLAVQSTIDAMVSEGIVGGLPSTVEFVGLGTVTYPEPPPAVATESPEVKQELSSLKLNIGRAGNTIGSLKLTEDETQEYQRLAGQLAGQYIQERMTQPDYQTLGDYEKSQALRTASNQAKEEARKQFITDSSIIMPIRGDSAAVKQSKRDLALVSEYFKNTSSITNDRALRVVTNILKRNNPGLEVALILNGFAEVNQGTSDTARALLSRRRNGSIEELPTDVNYQTVSTITNMVESYYGYEDKVWSSPQMQPYKIINDEISDLENGTDYDKAKAKMLLKRYPIIVKARQLIADYKKRLRQNRMLDYLLTNYN